jgi:protease II
MISPSGSGAALLKARRLAIGLAPAVAFVLTLACSTSYPPPPETKRVAVVDTLHGIEFVDPYRWLEDQDSPETRAWIQAQNAYAETIIGRTPLRAELERRLAELMDDDEHGWPIFRYDPKGGHAANRGRSFSEVVKDNAAELAFLLQQVDATGAGSRPRSTGEN